jgi:hypothetical protein
MTKHGNLLLKILKGKSDANIGFDELRSAFWAAGLKRGSAEATTCSSKTVLKS